MKLCVITPVPHLNGIPLGCQHLILTSLLKSHPGYLEFYKQRSAEGDHIILDNDAYEAGVSAPIDILMSMAKIVNPSVVVLSDKLRDCKSTIDLTFECFYKFDLLKYEMMIVPQGECPAAWEECLETILSTIWGHPNVNWIGIPRAYADDFGSWIPAVSHIVSYWTECMNTYAFPKIHLLGSPENIDAASEVERAFPGLVQSTDTAKPVYYAGYAHSMYVKDGKLTSDKYTKLKRPEAYFDMQMDPICTSMACQNIKAYRESINDK